MDSVPKKAIVFSRDTFFGILIALYVISNVYFFQKDIFLYSHYFGVAIFGLAVFDQMVHGKVKVYINKVIATYLIFVFYAIISFFWADSEEYYFELFKKIVFCAIIVFFFFNMLKWYKIKEWFLYGVVLSGLINILIYFGFFEYSIDEIEIIPNRFNGTMGNANSLAILMSLSLFSSILLYNFILKKRLNVFKWMFLLNIPLSLLIIFETGSRKGIIFGMGGLFVFFIPFFKSKKDMIVATFFAGLLLLSFYYIVQDDEIAEQIGFSTQRFEAAQSTIEGSDYEESSEERIFFTKEAFNIWMNNPILGIGFNNFRYYFGTYAHNNYAEIAATLGLIGIILFYLIYYLIFRSVFSVPEIYLRHSLLIYMFIILLMDVGWVSYFSESKNLLKEE